MSPRRCPLPRTHRPYPPEFGAEAVRLARGSELGWTDLGWTASARATGLDQFRFIVFGDPAWTVDRFNVETDVARAEDADRNTINALDPNIKPFLDRSGKLIAYHGWSDPQISPASSVQYFESVVKTLSANAVHGSYRLFMAPGMGHCSGGEGPNSFDMVAALEEWVERGKAPVSLAASTPSPTLRSPRSQNRPNASARSAAPTPRLRHGRRVKRTWIQPPP